MPLDPSIFMQGAALRNQNAQNLQAQLSDAVKLYASGKQKNKDGLDVVKLAEAAAYKKASGLEVTPEEDALAQGWDKIQSSSMALDPLGRPYQKQRSIFGDLAPSSGQPYSSVYGSAEHRPDIAQAASPFPPGFQNGSPEDVLDDPSQFNQMTMPNPDGNGPPMPKGLDMNALQPSPVYKPKSVAEGLDGRLGSDNPEVLKNDIEAQKQIIVDEAKARTDQSIKREDLKKMETDTLPVLQKMLELNEDTVDAPYAGAMQPVMRVGDPSKANAMDSLMQQRTALAAPLAKQLGVNPTDKDFQSTLDRIFNANSTKEGRRQQIQNLIEQTQGKYGIEGQSPAKPDLKSLKDKYGLQ